MNWSKWKATDKSLTHECGVEIPALPNDLWGVVKDKAEEHERTHLQPKPESASDKPYRVSLCFTGYMETEVEAKSEDAALALARQRWEIQEGGWDSSEQIRWEEGDMVDEA